ncbi:hypothetical protein BHM03_00060985, partial [Ensete ventricosum]
PCARRRRPLRTRSPPLRASAVLPLPAATTSGRGRPLPCRCCRLCRQPSPVRVAATAIATGATSTRGSRCLYWRAATAYARLLPARGRCLSAASARRLPLSHSRGLLLARGRRSAAVLPQPAFCSRTVAVRGCCLRATAGSTAAAVMQQCC